MYEATKQIRIDIAPSIATKLQLTLAVLSFLFFSISRVIHS